MRDKARTMNFGPGGYGQGTTTPWDLVAGCMRLCQPLELWLLRAELVIDMRSDQSFGSAQRPRHRRKRTEFRYEGDRSWKLFFFRAEHNHAPIQATKPVFNTAMPSRRVAAADRTCRQQSRSYWISNRRPGHHQLSLRANALSVIDSTISQAR